MTQLLPVDNPFTALDFGGQYRDAALRLLSFLRDRDAFADNTLRDLGAVVRHWTRWCERRALPAFPISEEPVRQYLLDLHAAGKASTTIGKHFAMLNMLLKQCGLPTLAENQTVALALRRIRREAVTKKGERTGQAIPLQLSDLRLLDLLLSRSGRATDLRNRAFMFVAYNTLLRMAEMARIRVRDVEFAGNHAVIHVSHTKTIATAAGIDKTLSAYATGVLRDWLDCYDLQHSPDAMLFPRIHRTDKILPSETPLSAPAIEKIFSDAWALAGKKRQASNKGRYTTWTGHSARVGATIDMAENQASMVEIMREGTWKNAETVMRYLRRSSVNAGAASRMMDR